MSSEDELVRFVREALAAGQPRDEIAARLIEAGWTAPQVNEALRSFSGTLAGVPIPRPRPSSGARDSFIYGGMFTSLFVTTWAFGAVLFVLIDIFFGDVPFGVFRPLRWPLSLAIVSTPTFVLLNRLVAQETQEDPNRRISDVRRKLTYLTLFVSAVVLLLTVASLIYNLLGGEIALTFLLKSAVVGGISGLGFVPYLREMRDEPELVPESGVDPRLGGT